MAGEDRDRLDGWLALLGGPGYRGPEARDRAIAEMRVAGAERFFPMLVPMLSDPNGEVRFVASEAVLRIDKRRGVSLVLPLLNDPEDFVQIHVCHCLGGCGDSRAVGPLIAILEREPDPGVRNAAAYALGLIASPAAIPPLLKAMESDHELDCQGHSPSSCAASALDRILGTDETCIHLEESCMMREEPPDLERLRRLAEGLYEEWSAGRV